MSNPFRNLLNLYRLKRMGVLNNGPSVAGPREGGVRFFQHPAFMISLFLLVLAAAVLFSLYAHPERLEVPELLPGMRSYASVQSQISFQYVDEDATTKAREAAAASVPFCYRLRSKRISGLLEEYDRFIRQLQDQPKKKEGAAKTESPVVKLTEEEQTVLSVLAKNSSMGNYIRHLLERTARDGYLSMEEKKKLPSGFVSIADDEERQGLQKFALTRERLPSSEQAVQYVSESAADRFLPEQEVQDFIRVFSAVMPRLLDRFALEPDPALTASRKTDTASSVEPVIRDVGIGEMLIRRNEKVTGSDIQVLTAYRKALQEKDQKASLLLAFGKSLAGSVLIVFFFFLALVQICPEDLRDPRKLWLLGGMTVIGILFNMAAQRIFSVGYRDFSIQPWLFFMALPLGFVSMTLAPLLGGKAALLAGVAVTSVAACSSPEYLHLMAAGLAVSAAVSFMVHSSMNYRSYLVTGFFTLFAVMFFLGLFLAWTDEIDFRKLDVWMILVPFSSAFASTILSQVVLYGIDFFFSCTTNMSLHILLDGDHPLLRKLQFEAPGTYHHSLMVSLLAEGAAREIGADGLLARVEALFHDVGKLYHPGYFTENGPSEDRYDGLTPQASARFIIKHVKAGVELARKYKLKLPIRDAIEQHHGRDLVYFFYKKAQESGQPVDESCFRYKGPLPRTREIAIVSLADACEAASRSLEKPTHARIKELVDSIVSGRLRSGQLDESGLTLCETAQIRECFTRILTSMLHARIAYPKEEEEK